MIWLLLLQLVTVPADFYELGLFRGSDLITPISVTAIAKGRFTCGLLPREPVAANAPNPLWIDWEDPANPKLVCRASMLAAVLALPVGTNYRAAIRSVAAKVAPSPWEFEPNVFRRASRGQPCPNNQPGVWVTAEADLNGKPVTLSVCIAQ